jgi:hypothetical protein
MVQRASAHKFARTQPARLRPKFPNAYRSQSAPTGPLPFNVCDQNKSAAEEENIEVCSQSNHSVRIASFARVLWRPPLLRLLLREMMLLRFDM